jgi:hypothetical protein
MIPAFDPKQTTQLALPAPSINVTKHATKRIRERAGINKRSAERFAQNAMERGQTPATLSSCGRIWVEALGLPKTWNPVIYAGMLFIFTSTYQLMTVYNAPGDVLARL